MTFEDFTFPEVCATFGLTLRQARLYPHVPPLDRGQDFLERMVGDIDLAVAIGTEKARSEFIVAPVLSEVRRHLKARFALFSGVEFSVDPSRGLNGFCDFLFTRSPLQLRITSPVIAIAEAKNDYLRSGFGQCIAAMVAAREFNADATVIHGVVTTGSEWQFATLAGNDLTFARGSTSRPNSPRSWASWRTSSKPPDGVTGRGVVNSRYATPHARTRPL